MLAFNYLSNYTPKIVKLLWSRLMKDNERLYTSVTAVITDNVYFISYVPYKDREHNKRTDMGTVANSLFLQYYVFILW